MATQLDNETVTFDSDSFQQSLHSHYRKLLKDFKSASRFFVSFNIFFLFLFVAQITYLFFGFSQTTFIAFTLGSLFLTCFSYFVLLFYFQAKKPEQFQNIVNTFLESCREAVGISEGTSEHHLSIAHAFIKLSTYLYDFEKTFYLPLKSFPRALKRGLESLSFFCHFHDVFAMKQLLLKAAIEEHIKQIRNSPTDLEVHTSLANTYVLLSKHYANTKRLLDLPTLKFHYRKIIRSLEEGFQSASKKAIEEFTIINHYAPNDVWVHMQLAESYRDLRMYENEIKEYETILKESPRDSQILFRLGVLYFEQGENAKGLKVYETLKSSSQKKAEELISFYGAYRVEESVDEM